MYLKHLQQTVYQRDTLHKADNSAYSRMKPKTSTPKGEKKSLQTKFNLILYQSYKYHIFTLNKLVHEFVICMFRFPELDVSRNSINYQLRRHTPSLALWIPVHLYNICRLQTTYKFRLQTF